MFALMGQTVAITTGTTATARTTVCSPPMFLASKVVERTDKASGNWPWRAHNPLSSPVTGNGHDRSLSQRY